MSHGLDNIKWNNEGENEMSQNVCQHCGQYHRLGVKCPGASAPAAPSAPSKEGLAESLAEFLHTRIVAAENSPINDPDEKFCEDCLNDAGTWIAANLLAQPSASSDETKKEQS